MNTSALAYLENHMEQTLAELKELLAIPSISTETSAKADIQRAAVWLQEKLSRMGARDVRELDSSGNPVIFAELGEPGFSPTVLVYGHYDVQPPDPLEAWSSDPFVPVERGGQLYARGAADMKGQLMAVLAAASAVFQSGIPIHVKFLLEGEEEIGSGSLPEILRVYQDLLTADYALNPDAGMVRADLPTITYALRGAALFKLRITGPKHDVHSGLFGGAIPNPAHVLCEVLGRLHQPDGKVSLEGFYSRVKELDEEERAQLTRLPRDDGFYLEQTGSSMLWGEPGYTALERTTARPTLEINSLSAGFAGEGFKAVVPAEASATISARLVPDQDPEEVHSMLRVFLQETVPAGVNWDLAYMVGVRPSQTDLSSPGVRVMAEALQKVWGVEPVYQRVGGGIPVVSYLQEIMGMESILTGFCLPGDNLHGPDEKLDLDIWHKGIQALAGFFILLGSSKKEEDA
ncbi:MAG: dipeptidase [Anaerolineales bacterium]|nr:dipeptidase [Anaerolineales bacterium]